MADIVSQEQRSKNMSAIRNKDTKPEIYIRHLLFSHGYRYRKNCSLITGCPDIYLAKYKTAIFINGCFWHRHANCKFAYGTVIDPNATQGSGTDWTQDSSNGSLDGGCEGNCD